MHTIDVRAAGPTRATFTMFVAQAHSFTQQARLAITLAWVAGYTNILTVLACGTVTSHVSGTASNLGRDIAEGKWQLGLHALYLLLTFLVGAAASGFMTELGRRKAWESIYVLPMAFEALLLAAFAIGIELFEHAPAQPGSTLFWLTGIASAAMGLQNATITRISNGVVRTTHVTGVLTDLGLELVQFVWWLSDKHKDFPPGLTRQIIHSARAHPTGRRLALLVSIIGSFAFGAALGTLAYDLKPQWAMFPPVLFLAWIILQDLRLPIGEIEPSDLVGGEQGIDLPSALALYHLRRGESRGSKVHRLPNLLAWSERLPRSTRVVILDLAEVQSIDANAAMELRAVLALFASQGRRLVIAGLNPEQFKQLRRAGAGDRLEPSDVCPDLELAIARGINLLEELLSNTSTFTGTLSDSR